MALLAIGVALRFWQYAANSSLWIDEATVARNIIDRPLLALLSGLDDAQVAPPVFLLVEKAVATTVGTSELALRLFPFLCGLFALVIFTKLSQEVLEGWAVPFAVGLFALGAPFIYFSSQVKQYSSDVAASVFILYVALRFRREPSDRLRAVLLGVVGAAMPWVSQPTSFVVAGIAVAMLMLCLRERKSAPIRTVAIVLAVWGVSVAGAGILAMRAVSPTDRAYFAWYWASGFWPVLPPHSLADLLWPLKQLMWAFGTFVSGPQRTSGGLNYPWSFVFVAVMLVGYVALWKQRKDAALFLVLPVAAALVASALKVYPFTGRLLVFLEPSLLLATAAGARHLLVGLPGVLQFAAPAILGVLGGSPIYAAAMALPPDRVEHLRPLISSMADQFEPNDAVYVYYGAAQAFYYYFPRFDISSGDVAIGRCSLARPRAYLEEIDRFRGRRRVWVLATHLSRWTKDVELLTAYLDAIGRRTWSITVPATRDVPELAAHLFLYDLSDREGLAAVSAATFPAQKGVTDELLARWGCYGVAAPLRAF